MKQQISRSPKNVILKSQSSTKVTPQNDTQQSTALTSGRSRAISQKLENPSQIPNSTQKLQQITQKLGRQQSSSKVIGQNNDNNLNKSIQQQNISPKNLMNILTENKLLRDEINQLRKMIEKSAIQQQQQLQSTAGSQNPTEQMQQTMELSDQLQQMNDIIYQQEINMLQQSLANIQHTFNPNQYQDSDYIDADDIDTSAIDEKQCFIQFNRYVNSRSSFGIPNNSCNVSNINEASGAIKQVYGTAKLGKIMDLNKASKNFNMPLSAELIKHIANQQKNKTAKQQQPNNLMGLMNLQLELQQKAYDSVISPVSTSKNEGSIRDTSRNKMINNGTSYFSGSMSYTSGLSDEDFSVPIDQVNKQQLLIQNCATTKPSEIKTTQIEKYQTITRNTNFKNQNNRLEMVLPKPTIYEDSFSNIDQCTSFGSQNSQEEEEQDNINANKKSLHENYDNCNNDNDITQKEEDIQQQINPIQLIEKENFYAHQIREVNFDNQKSSLMMDHIIGDYYSNPSKELIQLQELQDSVNRPTSSKKGGFDPLLQNLSKIESPQNFIFCAQQDSFVNQKYQPIQVSSGTTSKFSFAKQESFKQSASKLDKENLIDILRSEYQESARKKGYYQLDESLPQQQFLAIQQQERPLLEFTKSIQEDLIKAKDSEEYQSSEEESQIMEETGGRPRSNSRQKYIDYVERQMREDKINTAAYAKWLSQEQKEKDLVQLNQEFIQRTMIHQNTALVGKLQQNQQQYNSKKSAKAMKQDTTEQSTKVQKDNSSIVVDKIEKMTIDNKYSMTQDQKLDKLIKDQEIQIEIINQSIQIGQSPLVSIQGSKINSSFGNQSQSRYTKLAESVKNFKRKVEDQQEKDQDQQIHYSIQNEQQMFDIESSNETPQQTQNEQITVLDIQQHQAVNTDLNESYDKYGRLYTIREVQASCENYMSQEYESEFTEMQRKSKLENMMNDFLKENFTRQDFQSEINNAGYSSQLPSNSITPDKVVSSLYSSQEQIIVSIGRDNQIVKPQEQPIQSNIQNTQEGKHCASVESEISDLCQTGGFKGETVVLDLQINTSEFENTQQNLKNFQQQYSKAQNIIKNTIQEQPSLEELEEIQSQLLQKQLSSKHSTAQKQEIQTDKSLSHQISLTNIDMQESQMFSPNSSNRISQQNKSYKSYLKNPTTIYHTNGSYKSPIKQFLDNSIKTTESQKGQYNSQTIEFRSKKDDAKFIQKYSMPVSPKNQETLNILLQQAVIDPQPLTQRQELITPVKAQPLQANFQTVDKVSKEQVLRDQLNRLQERLEKSTSKQSQNGTVTDLGKSQTLDLTCSSKKINIQRTRISSISSQTSREQVLTPCSQVQKKAKLIEFRQQELESKLKQKEERIKELLERKKKEEVNRSLRRQQQKDVSISQSHKQDVNTSNQSFYDSRTPSKKALVQGPNSGIKIFKTLNSSQSKDSQPAREIPLKMSLSKEFTEEYNNYQKKKENHKNDSDFQIQLQSVGNINFTIGQMVPQTERNCVIKMIDNLSPLVNKGPQPTQRQLEFFRKIEDECHQRRKQITQSRIQKQQ